MKRLCGLMLVATLLAGCGGVPRLDATTDETVKASLERMGSGLTAEQKQEFTRSLAVVALGPALKASMKASFRKGAEPDRRASTTMKPVHGMTVAEINARAAELRAARKTAL